MQEINLLQSKVRDTTLDWQKRSKLSTNLLIAVLIIFVGAATALSLLHRRTLARYNSVRIENIESQNNLNRKQQELTSAKAFQAQLKNLSFLTNVHVYWSNFFDELAKHTFNQSQYVSVEGDTTGKIHIEGNVASYADLGKLILGLSTSEKFKQAKLLSASPTSSEQAGYLFSLDLTATPDVFNKK